MNPYELVKICYNPSNLEFPWYVVRTGQIGGQGGVYMGTEGSSFQTLDSALGYIDYSLNRDMKDILDLIEKKESEK